MNVFAVLVFLFRLSLLLLPSFHLCCYCLDRCVATTTVAVAVSKLFNFVVVMTFTYPDFPTRENTLMTPKYCKLRIEMNEGFDGDGLIFKRICVGKYRRPDFVH